MNKIVVFAVMILMLTSCASYLQDLTISACTSSQEINPSYSKGKEIQPVIDQLVTEGIPGCALAIYSDEGWWTSSAGMAKIENNIPMEACHLQYLQSVSKTYMAVGILKLYEQGKIDLYAPMTNYLPEKYARYITEGHRVTMQMLLNHTSGIPEYNFHPDYVAKLLQHPDYQFVPEDYLKYVKGKPLDFEPGSKYSYRNTNYVLLALIADALTGDHAAFLSETIFKPFGLNNTFYRQESDYPNYPQLVNSYWDRYSNSIVENVSQMQRNNVASLIGDDGIVATPVDAVKFLRGLMEGQLLKPATLELMKTWVNDSKGNPAYGLGLDYTLFQGEIAYGHSGGGIGAGCNLYYFPKQNVYVFIAINLGTVTDSPIHKTAEKSIYRFYEVLLK
ncbi:MAG: serine hydrolase domain-containing protein [Cyclobacteriaceae bacterium]